MLRCSAEDDEEDESDGVEGINDEGHFETDA
jgi:hypothetical protein